MIYFETFLLLSKNETDTGCKLLCSATEQFGLINWNYSCIKTTTEGREQVFDIPERQEDFEDRGFVQIFFLFVDYWTVCDTN